MSPAPPPSTVMCRMFGAIAVNVAVTAIAAVPPIGIVQVGLLPQLGSDHATVDAEPVAVNTIGVANSAVHVAPHAIPAGDDVIVPAPLPAWVTVSRTPLCARS